MRKFELPNIEMEKIDILDVITTSNSTDDECWTDGASCPNDALSGG